MPGIPVTFNTTAGTLSATREVTDGNGEARVRLTTDLAATVTATAGTKSGTVAISVATPVPVPTLTFAAPTGGTATSAGQIWTFTVTVGNTGASGQPVKFEWDFGDGTKVENNSPSITHAFRQELTLFNVRVTATFANGTTATASVDIITGDFP